MGRLQYIYNTSTSTNFPSLVCQSIDIDVQVEAGFSIDNQPSTYSTYFCFGNFNDSHNIVARRRSNGVMDLWFSGQHIGDYANPVNFPYTTGDYLDVIMNVDEYTVNGTVYTVYGTPDPQGTTISINMDSRLLCHFYYLRLKRNGTLLNEYVGWEENGTVGIKDLVSGTFYQPSSGTWTAGPPYVPPTPNIQVPINKYKLGANNITKTYEGGTKINKMYVGNNLVYRALPTTTGPQLIMPLDEVWYKTADGNSLAPKSNTYYIDSNGNQLTYTESFDSESGLWKMKFNGNVYGNQGSLYYIFGQNNRLLELWLPYGFVRPQDIFIYGQDTFEKFKGDSPAIVDNGNAVVCLVQDSTNTKDYVIQAVKNATTVTIPEGIIGLGGYAFYKLTATTVNLPSTISKLDYASCEQTNITTLNCYATTAPTVDSMAWWAVSNNGTLHYPTGSDYSSFRVPTTWTKVGDL